VKIIHFFIIFFFCMGVFRKSFTCPFTITNDTANEVFVVDPNTGSAISLKRRETKTIDPTVTTWWRYIPYFGNELLDFYILDEKDDLLHLRYRLRETFCLPESTQITISDLEHLVDEPTDRLRVKRIKQPESAVYVHAH